MIKGNITLIWLVAGMNMGYTLSGVIAYFLWGTPITGMHAVTLGIGLGLSWMAWSRERANKSDSK
jgi:hypothetical protein